MTPRLDAFKAAPDAINAMRQVEIYIRKSGLDHRLAELVRMRASQINHCAYCLHMHSKDARDAGETEARLYLLNAWRESALYSPKERAALAWTEALTLLAETQAPDEVYVELMRHFTQEEAVKLTLLIGAINVWNRISVGFRSQHPADVPEVQLTEA